MWVCTGVFLVCEGVVLECTDVVFVCRGGSYDSNTECGTRESRMALAIVGCAHTLTSVVEARAEKSGSLEFEGVRLTLAGVSAIRPAGRCLSKRVDS